MDHTTRKVGAIGAALLSLFTVFGSATVMPETSRGVDYRFGKITTVDTAQLRKPGLNFKTPFVDSIIKIPIDLQHRDYENVDTYTKDNQIIHAKLAVMFKIPEGEILRVLRNNPDWESKLERAVLASFKDALGHEEAQNVAQNREKVMKAVSDETQLKVRELLGFEVTQVLMPNFDFDDDFEKAVSTAANAKADLNRKQTELEQEKVEAQKKIAQADGAAQSTRKTADANAYRIDVESKSQAEAYNRISQAVGPGNMGTYLTTSKWNGTVPSVSGGSGTVVDMRQLAPVVANATQAQAPAPR